MRPRVLLAVVLFLVIPTAVLSIMAARFLRNREFFLDLHIKSSAVNNVRAVAERVDVALGDDLEDLRLAVAEVLARGGGMEDVGRAVQRLADSRPLVSAAYVFMNPWGFVYPRSPAGGLPLPAGDVSTDEALAPVLRSAITSADSIDQSICVTVSDRSYCFARLSAARALYIGYEVDTAAVEDLLKEALRAFSGGGVSLCAFGPGLADESPDPGQEGVVVRDSLAPEPGQPPPAPPVLSGAGGFSSEGMPLARGRLRPPLDFIEVCAYQADPGAVGFGARFMLQLTAWGVLLLVGAIILGVWVVLREASSEVSKAQSRSDFVLGVSHDLRTPVASMKMLAESLFEGRVRGKDKQQQFLGLLVRECERLSQLVERVLFFVRFGQNALVFEPVEIDPEALVRDAVRVFEARFKMSQSGEATPSTRERVAFDVQVEGRLPTVRVDEAALFQVLLNLFDNAWKYSRDVAPNDDGGAPAIGVSLRPVRCRAPRVPRERDWLAIAVRDHGIGIDADAMRHIFSRFYRGKAAEQSNVSGVGLGLALCSHVMRAHSGWIDVDSTPGQGSTFTLYLPESKVDAE